jgi:hypothetical protein
VRTAALETNRQSDTQPPSVVDRVEDSDDDAPTASIKRGKSADGEAPLPPTRPYGLGVAKSSGRLAEK